MNIEALAAQAGPLISTPFDKWCENFAHLIREAVVQELVAGSGEPVGEVSVNYQGSWALLRKNTKEGDELYTADQLAGAVLRERQKWENAK